jgi:branched-chain amino acid transport system ATP-binding protein
MLELEGVEVSYGVVKAIKGITFSVEAGEVVTLLGANGAGKTTTLRAICGLHRPSKGTIRYDGKPIGNVPVHEIVRLGLGHVPEGRHVFPRMSVRENLLMGAYQRRGSLDEDVERVFDLFPVLQQRRSQLAGTLSGGEQQMLAIGRALMNRPRMLLLDEPSMGLAPKIVATIFRIVQEINAQGTTVLLVEQNAAQALRVASRGLVLDTGEITMAADSATLLRDPRIREAYLGEGAA